MKKQTCQHLAESVKKSYNYIAKDWDATRKNSWMEFNLFLPHVHDGQDLLDLGCGNGRLVGFLENKKINYTGVDNSTELIQLAQKNFPKRKFQVGDASKLDFPDNSFDTVVSFAMIHHLPEDLREKVFREAARVLKSGGIFFFTTWNIFQPRYKKHIWQNRYKKLFFRSDLGWNDAFVPFGKQRISRYVHGYTPAEIKKLLGADFEIVDEYFTTKTGMVSDWRQAHNLTYIVRKK